MQGRPFQNHNYCDRPRVGLKYDRQTSHEIYYYENEISIIDDISGSEEHTCCVEQQKRLQRRPHASRGAERKWICRDRGQLDNIGVKSG